MTGREAPSGLWAGKAWRHEVVRQAAGGWGTTSGGAETRPAPRGGGAESGWPHPGPTQPVLGIRMPPRDPCAGLDRLHWELEGLLLREHV